MNWRALFRPRIVITNYPPLTEKELAGAFAVPEDDIRIRAICQVIAELEQDANTGAQTANSELGMSWANGGAYHLATFRNRIFELQQKGFGELPLDRN